MLGWSTAAIQGAAVPLLVGGFLAWGVNLLASLIAQFANIGSSVAGAADALPPSMEPIIGPLASSAVTLVAAPVLWVIQAAVLTAAARYMTRGTSSIDALSPTPSAILGFVTASIIAFVVQIPFFALIGIGGYAGWSMGSSTEENIVYAFGGASAVLLITFIPWIYIMLRLSLATAAAVVEGNGLEGIKASWRLTRRPIVVAHVFAYLFCAAGAGILSGLCCFTFGLLNVVIVPFFASGLMAAYLRATRNDGTLSESGFFE